MLLQAQGKLNEAEPLYRRALEGREKTLGPDHLHTLISVNNLGLLLYTQGKLNEAEPLLRRALEGREKEKTKKVIYYQGFSVFFRDNLKTGEFVLLDCLVVHPSIIKK